MAIQKIKTQAFINQISEQDEIEIDIKDDEMPSAIAFADTSGR